MTKLVHKNARTLHLITSFLFLQKWDIFQYISIQEGHGVQTKQKKAQRRDNPPLYIPPRFLPSIAFSSPSSPATFICCSINNCYCSFNYAPVISKTGGHVSSPSQGSLRNYRHLSKGQCSCSLVAVAIITPLLLTSVQWTRSPSGLSLSRHAFLCQAWPLTPPLALWGVFVYSERQGHYPPWYNRFLKFEYGYFANIYH